MECHKHDAGIFTVSALFQSQLKINDKVSNFRSGLFKYEYKFLVILYNCMKDENE